MFANTRKGKRIGRWRKSPSLSAPDPAFNIASKITKIGEIQELQASFQRGHTARMKELERELVKKCKSRNPQIETPASLRGVYTKKIQELKRDLEEKCKPHNTLIEELVFEIFMVMMGNRKIFTRAEREEKVQFSSGVFVNGADMFTVTPFKTGIAAIQSTKYLMKLRKKALKINKFSVLKL